MTNDVDPNLAAAERQESDDILIVSPNFALDHILWLGHLANGEVQAADGEMLSVGGKGVNVARCLRLLGVASTVHTVVGGSIGALALEMANSEEIAIAPTTVPGNTRIATIMVDAKTKCSTVLNPPGPQMSGSHWKEFLAGISDTIARKRPRIVVCTGSLPPGAPLTGYSEIVQDAHASGAFTMVDTVGSALLFALTAQPDLVKVNQKEAAECSVSTKVGGQEATSPQELAAGLLAQGAARAVITLGSAGAFASDQGNESNVGATPVRFANATGAGDAFLASLCASYARGESLNKAVRQAIAVAAASVETLQPGHFDANRLDMHRNAVLGGSK